MSHYLKPRTTPGVSGLIALCILSLCFAGCGSQKTGQSAPDASGTVNEPHAKTQDDNQPKTEVVVIATQHFISDMPEGYTPGHLRALLAKIAPDVLIVEAPTNVPDPWSFAPYELYTVTQPWAQENGKKIEPGGWHEPQYQGQLNQMFQQYQAAGKTPEYQRIEQEFQAKSAQPMTCQFMNSPACHELWRNYHAGLHQLLNADTPWETWNAKILDNVCKLSGRYKGQRVAVLFGGAHGYYLLDHLAQDPGVVLIPAAQFFPLSDQEIAANTKPVDYLKALRPLNFNVVSPAQLAQAKPLLEKVKQVPDFAGDYLLFHGKYLLHQRDAEAALAEFETLARYPHDSLSQFDGQSRLAEIAQVYAALALNQMGKPSQARARLSDITQDSGADASTRQWAQQLLLNIPQK